MNSPLIQVGPRGFRQKNLQGKDSNTEPETSRYNDVGYLNEVCEALERWVVIPSAE
jgi:hypothetical protein